MMNRQQQKKDKFESVTARRAAAEKLCAASALVDEAIRKLSYNKSDDIVFKLKQIAADVKEYTEILEDPDYDPQ